MTSDPGPGSNGFPLPPSYGPPSYGPVPHGPVPHGPVPHGPVPYGPVPHGPVPYGPPYGPPPVYGGYPYGQPQPVKPDMLAATADRERTVDVLKAAFIEGRLSQEEFDARSAQVMAARTYADLAVMVADLPVGPGGAVVPHHPYYPPLVPVPRTNGMAVGSLVCGIFPILSLPAVILGHAARGQIRQTGEQGDGLAVAGLVLGYMWMAFWMLWWLVLISH